MPRTALLYGALLGAFQVAGTLAVYACGLHASPDDIASATLLESILTFVVMMAGICLGLRAIRLAQTRAGADFTFRLGAKSALIISGIGALVTGLGQYLYVAVIHPAYSQHLRALYVSKTQFTPEQAAAYEPQLNFVTSPLFRGLEQGFNVFFFSLMVGVIYAVLFRARPAAVATARAS